MHKLTTTTTATAVQSIVERQGFEVDVERYGNAGSVVVVVVVVVVVQWCDTVVQPAGKDHHGAWGGW